MQLKSLQTTFLCNQCLVTENLFFVTVILSHRMVLKEFCKYFLKDYLHAQQYI